VIEECAFVGNRARYGGALSVDNGGRPFIRVCTFYANEAENGSAAFLAFESEPTFERSIIAFGLGGAPVVCESWSLPQVVCCDVFGNEGGDWVGCLFPFRGQDGNFGLDPLFCNAPAGDFTLAESSPCLPGRHPGDATCDRVGAFDQGCPIVPVRRTSWGAIKDHYLGD
jgi:hypothetical protein